MKKISPLLYSLLFVLLLTGCSYSWNSEVSTNSIKTSGELMLNSEYKDFDQKELDNCLLVVQQNHSKRWDGTCSSGVGNWINVCQGESGNGCNECILSDIEADRLNSLLAEEKEECYRRYKK